MPDRHPFYGEDLAFIHEDGFSDSVDTSASGLLTVLEKAGIRDGLIVDVGCGGGRWAQHLADAGYHVLGLDLSPAMVARARQRLPSGTFRVGSVWSDRLPRCRAVTALGEVICYRTLGDGSRQDPSLLFRRMFRTLEPGGLFIFDIAEVGLDRHRQPTFIQQTDWACLVRFEYDERQDRLTRHITTFRRVNGLFRRSRETHVLQLHRGSEIADCLREAGFRVRPVRRFGSQALLPGRVGFIARKP